MNKIEKEDVLKYLKSEVQESKLNIENKNQKLDMEMLKFYNTYSLLDRFFPFHYFLTTNDKIPQINIDYLCTFRYLSLLRYQFVNLMNQKYEKYLTKENIKTLKDVELKYFILNTIFYSIGMGLMIFRPIKRAKLLNFYFAAYFIFCSKFYSIYLLKDEIIPLKDKVSVNKPLKVSEVDVYDHTLIPDWRTYLYYYQIL